MRPSLHGNKPGLLTEDDLNQIGQLTTLAEDSIDELSPLGSSLKRDGSNREVRQHSSILKHRPQAKSRQSLGRHSSQGTHTPTSERFRSRGTIHGSTSSKRFSLAIQSSTARDPVRILRHKASSAYKEFLEVAMCRLKAANKISPPARQRAEGVGEQMLSHAWSYRHLPALSWIPYSFCLTRDTKPVIMAEATSSKRAMRTLTTLEFGAGQGHLRAKQEDTSQEDGQLQDIQCSDPLSESSSKLREAFRVAVSEAKLAQAQSLAAWRDVQNLKAVVERNKRSQHHGYRRSAFGNSQSRFERPMPRGGGGAAATAAATGMGDVLSQLQEHREQLRRREASLKHELQDVMGQVQRLQDELLRRHQRVSVAPEDVATTPRGPPSSHAPSEPSVSPNASPRVAGDNSRKILPKYLASSRVLPDLRHSPRRLRPAHEAAIVVDADCHSARESAGRHRLPQPALPSLSWRACTAP